ncbi:hypothetical protein AX279_07615 [Pseudomonas sp. J237]|nr:DUF4123 domain-containing protein [Pseudomonas sp. J237]OEO26663.1 hypothetical protein AX279_07615 [Pseudomonas sp. J237]
MLDLNPRAWIKQQRQQGKDIHLILDPVDEPTTLQSLLMKSVPTQYCSLYRETATEGLASSGPYLFLIVNEDDGLIEDLLDNPQRNWGWLASIEPTQLDRFAAHLRARLLVGSRPAQALYRMHDNRVLGRALAQIPLSDCPAYLGEAASVCYWQGNDWATFDNPASGAFELPKEPSWLSLGSPHNSQQIRELNAHQYLLAEHLVRYVELAEQQDPQVWLRTQLSTAERWGWQSAEQLEFLLTRALSLPALGEMANWAAKPGESPENHFERVYQTWQFWQSDLPV